MYSLSCQAKRPHREDSDEGIRPIQAPVRSSTESDGNTTMRRTGGGVAAAMAASRARKSTSQVAKQLHHEEEVSDYFEEYQEQEYTLPSMTYRNEKARLSAPDASAVGVFAVQGPGIDEENQVYVSTANENNNQNIQHGSINAGNVTLNPNQVPIEARCVSNNEIMHDQAKEIAELVQKELMANATVPVEVKSGGPPNTQDTPSPVTQEDGLNVGRRKKSLIIIVIGLLLLVAIAGIGVGVAVSKKPPDQPDVPTQPPASSPTPVTTRIEAFQILLTPISGELLSDTNSVQFQALNWLSNDDAASMTVGVDPEAAIKTRYVAAVLYYAFQGDMWTNKYNFLSQRDVCDWNQIFFDGVRGLSCDADGTVKSIQLRK